MSETAKQRHLTEGYCTGNGCDVGSGGDPVVPWAISIEQPEDKYQRYTSGTGKPNVQWRGDGRELPFKDATLDFVYSSHLLEDFEYWGPVLREWVRVLKVGGHLVILIPDKELFRESVASGRNSPNCAHKHEGFVGEISTYADNLGLRVIEDQLCNSEPFDYNILFVAVKL